jgi:tetratricopeptide (TPR) repeat protein
LLNARDRLRLFKELQNPVMLAVVRRPDLPEAWQLLGRWHYRVAHYNTLEKLFSQVVLGGVPRSASTDQAIAALEKARALAPERIQYTYDLARIYKYQGHHRRYAIALLQQAIRQPTYTSEDLVMNRLCVQLLAPMVRAAARRDRRHARWYQHLRAVPRPAAAGQAG